MAELEFDHRLAGSGELLFLIHGIGSTWRVWKPVLDRLEAQHEVLAVDVPGFGHSAPFPPGTRPTIDAMADSLERVLDAVGWDAPPHAQRARPNARARRRHCPAVARGPGRRG